ncbi:MAG: response regulator [Candidatus Rokubacteria bacterium]|nr:response regulator [Candidatus Rokubacteria bacterium]
MPTSQSPAPVPDSQPHILVVDDDPLVTQLIVDTLTREGYRVDSAPNGVAALEKIQHQHYDLILSDLHMPQLNGVGLYLALTQQSDRLSERIIFLTGSAAASDLHRFLKETGLPVLRKPFALVELLRLVRQVLESR